MSTKRLEWRVGLFVFIGLALLAVLMIGFSKGVNLFRPTYTIYMDTSNVGGLKPKAGVLMSGVQIGTVGKIDLNPTNSEVTVALRIYKPYQIHTNAEFFMATSGFLGDQYVGVYQVNSRAPILQDGQHVSAEAPFDFQQFTRSASGFISRIDETVKNLNQSLDAISKVVLNPITLTNMAEAVGALRKFSEEALATINDFHEVVVTNRPALAAASTNLEVFSERLNTFANHLNGVLADNAPEVQVAVKNVETSTEILKHLLADVQAGKGLAGDLLKNPQIAANVSQLAYNLSVTSSNLNRLGFWGILWQHKPPGPAAAPAPTPLASPKAQGR